MSGYNRGILKKLSAHDADSAMDESGYASFKALHNSTVEAPFLLLDRDSETENCRNASNTTTKSSYKSLQFQTPSCNELNSTANTTRWHRSLSLPAARTVRMEESEDEREDGTECKSPLLLTHVPMCTKRRKSHFQPMAHHSSPKKSKKKLFPQPAPGAICRKRYYDGVEQLDIVGMLSHTLPALECILANVSSHTLDVMTQVSQRWALAVHQSQRAVERLQNHRFKMSCTKENSQPVRRGRMLSKNTNTHLVPLQTSNAIRIPNKHNNYSNIARDNNCLLVEQMQRIKCPRCGKCSKVFYAQAPQQITQQPSRAALSQTLPHTYSFSEPKSTLTRFYSLDEVKSTPDENVEVPLPPPPQSNSIGECTSISCRFRFCVHCCCPPHPGERCLVTELGTPSKVMMPSGKTTPPKRNQKCDYKLSRKNSLKRLNF